MRRVVRFEYEEGNTESNGAVLRPVPGASQYAAPVPGLYLCCAGTHPGGGVMGAAGFNAAQRIIGDGRAS